MKTLGYYNGKYGELDDMTVPMNDRVSWFGDGVYDALPARNYKMFAIDEHIDRFFNSAKLLDIKIPVGKEELEKILYEMINKMDTGNLFVYFQATRGTEIREHQYDENKPGNLWIMLKPGKVDDGKTPITLSITEDKRFYYCNCKTLNLIPSVLAAQIAKREGTDETVFVRPEGRVTECAHSNVHIIKNGVFKTAPTDCYILPGIARKHLLKACAELGIPYEEKPFTKEELFDADEIIVSSSSKPCLRAIKLDGKDVGAKDPVTYEKLRNAVVNEIMAATEAR